MKLKIAAAIALVAVGVGAIGFAILLPGTNGTSGVTYLTAQATVTDVTEEAVASGTIAAATTYALSFGSESQATAAGSASSASSASSSATSGGSGGTSVTWPVSQVNVAVGDVVGAGEVLATADPLYAELQVTIARANLEAAEARLVSDTNGADALTRRIAQGSVSQAANQLAQARQSYSTTVRQNALSLKQARAEVASTRAQLLADTRSGAPSQTIAADKKAWDQARQNLAKIQLQTTASNQQASNQVTNASLQLTSARNSFAKQVAGADDAQVASDEAAVATAESALAAAQAVAEHPTIVAPVDGRITAVNIGAGSDAPSGAAIAMQSAALAVTASFAEEDVLSLQVGQQATVTISATDASATGTVASISSTASGTGGSSVVSYAVVILLDNATAVPSTTSTGAGTTSGATTTAASAAPGAAASAMPAPLPGMSAEVSITVAEAAGVVAVPAAAVSGTGGQYVVRVMGTDGQVQARPVEVGLVTSSLAEITSGVAAGDQVVTGTSADQVTTTTTQQGGNRNQFPGGISIPGAMPGGMPGGGG
ncbi:MAG: HlyD family efflux transporter periplasmic adaptor subunit [Chloroflexi bacterium]|nr:HlyD family efflux transporter periplasmic adaptor subunit [Chloroflexota bacterium]